MGINLTSLKSIITSCLLLIVLYLTISINPMIAMAQSPSGLTIIPPKFELFGNPGDILSEKIRIRNDSAQATTYSIIIEDFTTSGEEGHVVLEEEGETINTTFSLAKWLEPSTKDIILQPKEEQIINFLIKIPKDAEPGGHYASILFQSVAETAIDQGAGAKVSQRVGSLVLLRVTGNVTEDAQIEEFSTAKYSEKTPIELLLRLKNNGNTHIIPQGTIVITNFFGKKVDELPLDSRNVLPGAIRKMTTAWDKPNMIGNFTATLIATYGQNNQPLTASFKFTVMPKSILILGIVGLIAIIGLFMTIIFGRKKLARMFGVMFKE